MEINRTITNVWTIVLHEKEVFARVTDSANDVLACFANAVGSILGSVLY